MDTIIRNLEFRIDTDALNVKGEEYHRGLMIDKHYGAPYSYWRSALDSGLATQEEFDMARASYGNLWHYRGD